MAIYHISYLHCTEEEANIAIPVDRAMILFINLTI